MVYQASFFDHADRIFGHDRFEAEGDDLAIERALVIYQNNVGKGYHLHRGEQHVHTHVHGIPPEGAA